MTDKTKPRRTRRLPHFGPIDTSRPRRAESELVTAMRELRERGPLFREDDAQITVGGAR